MLTIRGTVVLVVAAGLLLVGLSAGVEEFILLALALTVVEVVVVAWVLWCARRARRSLRARTDVGRADLLVGDDNVGRFVLTNAGPDPIGPLLVETSTGRWRLSRPGLGAAESTGADRDSGGDASGAAGTRRRRELPPWRDSLDQRVIPVMGRGGIWSMDVPVPTDARGLLALRPLRVWVSDPFGLAARLVGGGSRVHVAVCPRPADVGVAPFSPTEVGQRNAAPIEGPARAWRPAGDELADLRDYRPGDRVARLHWPALARTGELVVRDFVEPLGALVPMLIDLQPDDADPDGPERAIGVAARVGLEILAAGCDVEVRTTAGDRAVVQTSSDGRARLLRVLALLRVEAVPGPGAGVNGVTGTPSTGSGPNPVRDHTARGPADAGAPMTRATDGTVFVSHRNGRGNDVVGVTP